MTLCFLSCMIHVECSTSILNFSKIGLTSLEIMQKSLRTATVRFYVTTSVKPVPDGYHAVTPYLVVHDAKN